MNISAQLILSLAGSVAGAVNGMLGGGGGMVLVPLLTHCRTLEQRDIFPVSVCIMLPICIVSLLSAWQPGIIPWNIAIPCLVGSTVGGISAGIWGKYVPTVWLHRLLGILIIWGGIRYLC